MAELSLGELDSLVLKAYRGAGFSWGMAQEAGRAAAWLGAQGIDVSKYFAELLIQIDGLPLEAITPKINKQQWQIKKEACCPVVCGTALSDLGLKHFNIEQGAELHLGLVHCPAILLPFVASCSMAEQLSLEVKINDQSIVVGAHGALQDEPSNRAFIYSKAEVVICRAKSVSQEVSEVSRRVNVTEAELMLLEGLAYRTYVPSTEESRSSGAGAGLTDND